jgi:hypothetical protein
MRVNFDRNEPSSAAVAGSSATAFIPSQPCECTQSGDVLAGQQSIGRRLDYLKAVDEVT